MANRTTDLVDYEEPEANIFLSNPITGLGVPEG